MRKVDIKMFDLFFMKTQPLQQLLQHVERVHKNLY